MVSILASKVRAVVLKEENQGFLLPFLDVQNDVSAHLLQFLTPVEYGKLFQLTRNTIVLHDAAWKQWYEKVWAPQSSLFRLKEVKHNRTWQERFRGRQMASRKDLVINHRHRVYLFEGFTLDISSLNITPASAACVFNADHGFKGRCVVREGAKHSAPAEGMWTHGFVGAYIVARGTDDIKRRIRKKFYSLHWREKLPTNLGYFEYTGRLSLDSFYVFGHFKWSCFPNRVKGVFGFRVYGFDETEENFENLSGVNIHSYSNKFRPTNEFRQQVDLFIASTQQERSNHAQTSLATPGANGEVGGSHSHSAKMYESVVAAELERMGIGQFGCDYLFRLLKPPEVRIG
jgi:hypothetical protein